MSNKESNTTQPQDQNKHTTKVIEVGKFYLIYDGSKTGHPGFIVWKNDVENRYLVIRTESDKKGFVSKRDLKRQHLLDLKQPTDSSIVKSYIRSRPLMCKRKDIGSKELIGMSFSNEDIKIVLMVSKRKPNYTKSFKKIKTTDEPTRG